MTTFGEKFRALLATGRVANLPTVWSNVLVGFWLSSLFVSDYNENQDDFVFWSFTLLFLLIASSSIYVGGCMLGDARDIDFDRANRPNRPIPQGILSTSFVTLSAWSLMFGGLLTVTVSSLISGVIAYKVGWADLVFILSTKDGLIVIQAHEILLASLLITCVIAYAFIHKKDKRIGLTLMASCRLLLVIFAISAAHKTFFQSHHNEPFFLYREWGALWMPLMAGTVGVYTLLLSWVASTESKPGQFHFRKILAPCMLALPLVSFIIIELLVHGNKGYMLNQLGSISDLPEYGNVQNSPLLPPSPLLHILMLLAYVMWTLYALNNLRRSKPAFVSNALAGFCLLDACMAATFSPLLAFICLGLFGFALLLQKVTPAT